MRAQLAESETKHKITHETFKQTVQKMRWLQAKAVGQGSGEALPGRHRALLYWESLKFTGDQRSDGRQWMSRWGDDYQSGMSAQSNLEFELATAHDGYAEAATGV